MIEIHHTICLISFHLCRLTTEKYLQKWIARLYCLCSRKEMSWSSWWPEAPLMGSSHSTSSTLPPPTATTPPHCQHVKGLFSIKNNDLLFCMYVYIRVPSSKSILFLSFSHFLHISPCLWFVLSTILWLMSSGNNVFVIHSLTPGSYIHVKEVDSKYTKSW